MYINDKKILMLVKQYFVFVFFRAPEPSAFDFDDTASEASSKVQMTPRTPGQYSTASRVLTQFCLAQELCENGGGRPGLPVPNKSSTVSVNVKQN